MGSQASEGFASLKLLNVTLCVLSCFQLFVTPQAAAHQGPLSMKFSSKNTEQVAISSSMRSPQCKGQTCISYLGSPSYSTVYLKQAKDLSGDLENAVCQVSELKNLEFYIKIYLKCNTLYGLCVFRRKKKSKIKLIKLLNCFKFKNYHLSLDKQFNKLIPRKVESHYYIFMLFLPSRRMLSTQ